MGITLVDVPQGKDTRDKSRFHVKLIFGTRFAYIVDTKCKPNRTMKLPLDEVVTEANFRDHFACIVEALNQTWNEKWKMADGESAVCITYPEGSMVTFVQ